VDPKWFVSLDVDIPLGGEGTRYLSDAVRSCQASGRCHRNTSTDGPHDVGDTVVIRGNNDVAVIHRQPAPLPHVNEDRLAAEHSEWLAGEAR
jgi:hypothetical protein